MELFLNWCDGSRRNSSFDRYPLPSICLRSSGKLFGRSEFDQVLESRGWSESDLDIHIKRPEALRRFARQRRFGPGLEETFLASGGKDEVIYSFARA